MSKHINYHSTGRPRDDARVGIDDEVEASLLDLLELARDAKRAHVHQGQPIIAIAVMLAFAWGETAYLPKFQLSRQRNTWGFPIVTMFVDGVKYRELTNDEWRRALRWLTLAALSKYAYNLDLNPEPLCHALQAAGPEPIRHCFGVGAPRHER